MRKIVKLKQYNKNGCGQTCVAMITGTTEAHICETLGLKGKTHYDDLTSALMANGFRVEHISLRGRTRRLPKFGIVLLKHKTSKSWGHWIVIQDNQVFDPGEDKGPIALTEYERDHMLNIRYVGYLDIIGEPRGK